MKIGILGYGEIGRAISKLYQRPKIKDLKRDDGLFDLDVLNVCIPYSKDFVKIVKAQIVESNPGLTIIHSTVPVGTTSKIKGIIVHSPVRGVHPNLHKSLKTFYKFVGFYGDYAGLLAKKHFKEIGVKIKIYSNPETTEAMKIWSTTQYGLFIVLQKEIKKYCERYNLPFDVVYNEANRTYNEGYEELKMPNVVRPTLKHMAGKIGGHCVIPNCRLLNNSVSKFILKQNQNYGKK